MVGVTLCTLLTLEFEGSLLPGLPPLSLLSSSGEQKKLGNQRH
jgi:hypothetical protein